MSLQARGNALRENRENQRPRQNGKAAGNGKRNALGNVTNQVRRQPLRAAKDKHTLVGTSKSVFGGQENEIPKTSNNAGFAIFQDVTERVPPHGILADLEQDQEVAAHDVFHIDDQLMQDKENDHISEAIMGLPAPVPVPIAHLGVLQPLHVVDAGPIASPMAVDNVREAAPVVPARATRDPVQQPPRRDEYGLDAYCEEIFHFLRAKEASSVMILSLNIDPEISTRPGVDFMSRQTDVSMSMRNILVDWLVEVGEEYKLNRETLFLAINYIDRFLSLVRVERPKLQLVGAACMFIAAKYEEIYPPDVGEFVYITDDTYTKRQVLKMESVILKLLEFKVAAPTTSWFLEHYLERIDGVTDTVKFLAYFFAELSLIEVEDFLNQRPSIIAASCVVLARSTLNMHPVWPSYLEQTTRLDVVDMLDCVKSLYGLYKRISTMPQQAVVEKYKQEKFLRVALIPPSGVLTLL